MTNNLDQLMAISPIDGRYLDVTAPFQNFFSEYAYFKTCLEIEIKYFIFLSKIKIFRTLTPKEELILKNILGNFSPEEAYKLKNQGTPDGLRIHDLKSVEYYLKNIMQGSTLSDTTQWIHFGLTSNDVVDSSYRILVKEALNKIIIPEISIIENHINRLAEKHRNLPMLGRTHGQPAVPTTYGKEMAVFSARIKSELKDLKNKKLYGKFGGAIGNWNALNFAFPSKDWVNLSTKFLKTLGLEHSKTTTQIAPTEDLIKIFQNIFRINSIIIDFDQDIWRYISDDWLVQKGKTQLVGSSTMPQKINPVEFENSEGNLVIANGLFETFARKLPISRLQRDLSDSTVLRNIGVAFAHSLVAYESCQKGIATIEPNTKKMSQDLNRDWGILAEAFQTILRKEGNLKAYEKVADQVRGRLLTKNDWIKMIQGFEIRKKDKALLEKLTPSAYIGIVKSKW